MKLPQIFKSKKFENQISTIAILYFMFGVIFAFVFAINYQWSSTSYLSPRFFEVVFTWPFQMPGLLADINRWGFASKPPGF